jgi:hypothetical protein
MNAALAQDQDSFRCGERVVSAPLEIVVSAPSVNLPSRLA